MKVTVDRIEGELAVLLLRDNESVKFDVPIILIPGVREGDIIDITFTIAKKETDDTKERVASLIDKLKKK